MSDPDPVKALREWCGLPKPERSYALDCCVLPGARSDVPMINAARALLAAAPAILARLEAGKQLAVAAQALADAPVACPEDTETERAAVRETVATFLAAKEANRG